MIEQRLIQCPDCKNMIKYYIEERKSSIGIKQKCSKCGKTIQCLKKDKWKEIWREIPNE